VSLAFTLRSNYLCGTMLKRFTAILLLVALVTANFSRYFVYAGFELNKKYIAATLCENRDKPWMHCNGQCYFMKKVKAVQDAEKNDSRQAQKNLFQEVFVGTYTYMRFYNQLLQLIDTPYSSSEQFNFKAPLLQPPRQA
jgi:hypothetical protein